MTKKILLTQDRVTLVDDEDYNFLMQWKWHYRKGGYVGNCVYVKYINGKTINKTTLMHRLILNAPFDKDVDHINHNGLDNRKCNLRLCDTKENCRNQLKQKRFTTSKYKGVYLHTITKKWIARIGKPVRHIGCFDTEKAAAIAYNEAAKKFHGNFAKLNEV